MASSLRKLAGSFAFSAAAPPPPPPAPAAEEPVTKPELSQKPIDPAQNSDSEAVSSAQEVSNPLEVAVTDPTEEVSVPTGRDLSSDSVESKEAPLLQPKEVSDLETAEAGPSSKPKRTPPRRAKREREARIDSVSSGAEGSETDPKDA
jgi:hypothetical protein